MASTSSGARFDVCCTAFGSAASVSSSGPGLKTGCNAVVRKWMVLVSSSWEKVLVASACP